MSLTLKDLRKLVIKEMKNEQSVLIEYPIVGQEQTGDYTKDPNAYTTQTQFCDYK